MSIRIHNFMGIFGWQMQKHFPMLSSNAYLKLQFFSRKKSQRQFIDFFNSRDELMHPLIVNLETINRCNGTCAFCTANKTADKRPLKKMDEKLFYSIIDQLAEWGYK